MRLSSHGRDMRAEAAEADRRGPRLRPPRSFVKALDRPFLLALCREALRRQVLVLHAPAGYGKTELLRATYLACRTEEETHVGWLTLTAAHGDRALLRRELSQALDLPASDNPAAHIEHIAMRRQPTLLFLDNLDTLPQRLLVEELGPLFDEPPDMLAIACAARARPALPLARLQVRGLVGEIGPDKLAFSRSEIRRMLGPNPAGTYVEVTTSVSRGWPAIVKLIADLPAGPNSLDAGAPLPTGLDDYVSEVILSDLDKNLLRAFEICSVLDEFPLALVDDLTEGGCDTAIIANDRLAPMVEESRPNSGWFRMHPVLRAHFTARLAARGDGRTETLCCRAAGWFAEHGWLEQAVSHAARGGDYNFAVKAITGAGGVNLFIRVGHDLLKRLIDYLPTEVVFQSAQLSLCYALVLAKDGRLDSARELIGTLSSEQGEQRLKGNALPNRELEHIKGLIDIYCDRQLDRAMIALLEAAVRRLGPRDTWDRGWLYNHLCIAFTRTGDLRQAHICALKALECYQECDSSYAQIFMLLHLGLVHTLLGNFSAALASSREARDLSLSAQWRDQNLRAIALVPLAENLYYTGEIVEAERILRECVPQISRGEGWVDLYTRMFSTLARVRLRLHGVEAAINTIDRAERVAIERNLRRLGLAAAIMRIEIFTRTGMLESAEHVASTILSPMGEGDHHETWTWRERNDFLLARARLRLAAGRAAEALTDTERLMTNAESNGSGYYKLYGTILSALTAWAGGHHNFALESLQSAIALARPHQLVQPFLDENPVASTTIRAIVRRFGLSRFSSDAVDFIGQLAGSDARATGASYKPHARAKSLPRQLFSPRESEVLASLVQGRTNKEIARDLDVSEATVKFHLKNIFAKLGVSRRTVAVAVAEQLGILKTG